MSADYKIRSRQFLAAAAVNFLMPLNFFMVVPITVLLTEERYDAPLALGAAAAGALMAGAVGARPFVALLLAGRSVRRAMIGASAASAACTALCVLPVDIVTFALLRVGSGAAFAVASTAALVVGVSGMPADRRGSATGLFQLSNGLAGAVGPTLGLLVARGFGHDAVLIVVAATAGLASIAALTVPRAPVVDPTPPEIGSGLRRFVEPRVARLCVVVALVGAAYGGVFSFLEPWSDERGLAAWAPAFFGAYAVMVVLARPLAGHLVDRLGSTLVLVPGLGLLVLGVVLVSSTASGPALVVAGVITGAGIGTVLCAATVMAVATAPAGRLAVTVSTFYLALEGAVAFGPVALAPLVDAVGYSRTFAVMAALVAVATLVQLTSAVREGQERRSSTSAMP